MTTLTEYLNEAGKSESNAPLTDRDYPAHEQPLHECVSRQVMPPPANVRDWQDGQPEKMLDRYKVAPIDLPD